MSPHPARIPAPIPTPISNHDPAVPRALESLLAQKFGAGWILQELYTYRAADGAVSYYRTRLVRRGVRQRPGAKPCFQSLHHAGLRWSLREPPFPPQGRPLYNLHQLHGADASRWVYLTQDEASADALGKLAQLATTCGEAIAVGTADWRPLRCRRVRIWPAAGCTGQATATDLAGRLRRQGCTIELLEADQIGLAQGQTARDWCELYAEAGQAEVEALSWQPWPPQLAASSSNAADALVTQRASDVPAQPLRWLWPGRIALGKLSLIAGDPGLGKSLLTAELAARISRGDSWPADGSHCPRGEALLLSGEDNPGDTIRPRLEAAGADTRCIYLANTVKGAGAAARALSLCSDANALSAFLSTHPQIRLVCIDPISAYLGAVDSHRHADVRAVLHQLAALAERASVAIIAISHLTKSGGSAVHRVIGSLAFVAAARASYIVTKDQADPRRRLILPAKNNLGQDASGIAYRIVTAANGAACIEWETDKVNLSADDALKSRGEAQRVEHAEAVDWLLEALAQGQVPARQLRRDAAQAGIAWRTLQRTRKSAGVATRRVGFGREATYVWQLQDDVAKPG